MKTPTKSCQKIAQSMFNALVAPAESAVLALLTALATLARPLQTTPQA
jgi:hypothetical protein